ncbi:hypothetical protein LOTGIDRAFT_234840 [Lottia gigantea]|uniref:UBC core domain-containing protein n=1 Tax=Lottia gigantea TaxID=225164 RepID=V3ZYV1_LOTGI|nr:hypothetical protein LOTGIDRAFT_234840 [Lottia gigantea]ESO87820.1 hypothetical protein LOTGIDRAFT_234840 [Lottia gigantea]
MEAKDFEIIKEEATEWTSKTGNDFNILSCDESEKRIDFHIPDKNISFYVVQNTFDQQNTWHLWSDQEKILSKLSSAIEKCGSCQTTLTAILDSVSSCLKQVIKDAMKENDDDDDDDEFVDCEDEGLVEEDDDDDDDGDDNDDDSYYYNDDDNDESTDTNAKEKKDENDDDDEDDDDDTEDFFGGDGNPTAVARLVKDMKNMQKIKGKYGIEGSPKGGNLFVWDVKLTDIPTDSKLGQDLVKYSQKYHQQPVINLEMQFPRDYPFSPPFIRVIRPRFQFLTGHVTIGGSICMQMLTKSGWTPSNDIELILIQVRSEILSDANARLAHGKENDVYSLEEAKRAFDRMVERYNWNK